MRLEDIKVTKVYKGKSTLTSGDKSMIYITYNKNTISFMYHDNYLNKSDLEQFLDALFIDAESYDSSTDVIDFMLNFGYDSKTEAQKIYKACEKQHARLNKLFNEHEQEQLKKLIDHL